MEERERGTALSKMSFEGRYEGAFSTFGTSCRQTAGEDSDDHEEKSPTASRVGKAETINPSHRLVR